MFNYFACRKIAEKELNKSLQDIVDFQNEQKMKVTRDKLAKRYKLRVVSFVKEVSRPVHPSV